MTLQIAIKAIFYMTCGIVHLELLETEFYNLLC